MQKLPTHCELLQRNVRLQFLPEIRGKKATYETVHTLRPWSVVHSSCRPWQDVSDNKSISWNCDGSLKHCNTAQCAMDFRPHDV